MRGRAVSPVIRLTCCAGSSARKTVPVGSSPTTGMSAGSKSSWGPRLDRTRPFVLQPPRCVGMRDARPRHRITRGLKPRMRPWPLRPFIRRLMFGDSLAVAFHEPPRCWNAEGIASGAMPWPLSSTRTRPTASITSRSITTFILSASASNEFQISSITASTGRSRCARRRIRSSLASIWSRRMHAVCRIRTTVLWMFQGDLHAWRLVRREAPRRVAYPLPRVPRDPLRPSGAGYTSGGQAGAPGVRDCGGAGWWPFRLLEPAREGGPDAVRCGMREALGRQLGRGTVG